MCTQNHLNGHRERFISRKCFDGNYIFRRSSDRDSLGHRNPDGSRYNLHFFRKGYSWWGRVDKSGNITIKVGETNMIMKSVEKKKSSWVSTRNYGKRQVFSSSNWFLFFFPILFLIEEDLFHRQPNKDVPTKFQIETHAVKFVKNVDSLMFSFFQVYGDQFTLFHSLTKFLFSISFSIRGSYIQIEFATRKPSEPLMLTSTSRYWNFYIYIFLLMSDLEVTMGRVMVNIVWICDCSIPFSYIYLC